MEVQTRTNIEAAVFRRLVEHFQKHTEIQNIDLMITGDFCRNCLSKWFVAAAKDFGENVDYEQARELIYGMPYEEWRDKYQKPASGEQLAAYEKRQAAKNQ